MIVAISIKMLATIATTVICLRFEKINPIIEAIN